MNGVHSGEIMGFDLQPILKGNLLELRPLQAADFDDLFANRGWQTAISRPGAITGYSAFFNIITDKFAGLNTF